MRSPSQTSLSIYNGKTQSINVGHEVVLSLGAINTPKVLMQSGIGDQAELQRFGIRLVQHLPGVRQNFQDHFGVSCIGSILNPLLRVTTFVKPVSFGRAIHPSTPLICSLASLNCLRS